MFLDAVKRCTALDINVLNAQDILNILGYNKLCINFVENMAIFNKILGFI